MTYTRKDWLKLSEEEQTMYIYDLHDSTRNAYNEAAAGTIVDSFLEKMNNVIETEIPFSKNWTKLSQKMFTTLRKSRKAKANEYVEIYNRETRERFNAQCVLVQKIPLAEISTSLLQVDTDTNSREEAIQEIQSFYRTPLTPSTIFWVHLFQKEASHHG